MPDIAELGLKVDTSQLIELLRQLEKLKAQAGPAAAGVDNLEKGALKASVSHRALTAALSGVNGSLIAMSAGAGPVGTFLAALGPWGFAAAVGLGAAQKAIAFVSEESARMGDRAVDLRSFSLATELNLRQIGALRGAGAEVGAFGDGVQTAFEFLTRGLTDARRATGTLYDEVQKINGGLAKELENSTSTTQGINILARAYREAGDASAKLSLSKAVFSRGGAQYGPILGKIDDAGGLDALAAKSKNLSDSLDATNDRWATMRTETTELKKRADNILASIFTQEGLEGAKLAAQYSVQIATALKDAANAKAGLSGWQRFLQGAAQFGMEGAPVDPQQADEHFAKAAAAAKLPEETIAAWGRFEDSLSKVVPIADAAAQSLDKAKKSTLELQTAAAAASKTQQDLNAFLGSGATIQERLAGRLKDIASAYADNRTGAPGTTQAEIEANAKLLKARAEAAASLDALIQREGLRLSIWGQLAPLSEILASRQDQINKANEAGAGITRSQVAHVMEFTRLSELGIISIRQQTDAEKINIATLGMGVGAAAAYRVEQERLNEARLKGKPLSDAQIKEIHDEADAFGKAAQAAALLRANLDTAFSRAQLGRTTGEENVATQLRAIYGDKEYASHTNDAIANQIRFNDTLKDTKAFGEDALSGLLRDFRDLKSGADIANNVLVKLENKLFDIASNKIMSSLIGSVSGGLPSLFGGGSIAPSVAGPTGFAIGGAHEGAIVGSEATFVRHFASAPRFHSGGMIGMDEVPIIAKRGEGVFTENQMAKLAPVGSGSGPVTVNLYNAPADTRAEVTQSKTPGGGTQFDIRLLTRMIDDTVAGGIRGRQSATHSAIKETFGASDKL